MDWTEGRVAELAPDPASLKAAGGLVSASKWVSGGRDARALWGEAKGSGKSPYQVRIDVSGPAFKCSCPSRKFPCKHGLALALIAVRDPARLVEGDAPAWVTEWLDQRGERAAKQEARAQSSAPPDAAAQAKRREKRDEHVDDGVAELRLWLRDTVRAGLAARGSLSGATRTLAARMVDAQAPGLARRVESLAGVDADEALERLGTLWLLTEAWGRRDTLSPEERADVETAVGFTVRREDVLAGGTVEDTWLVLAREQSVDGRLTELLTVLWGTTSDRAALVLDFGVQGSVVATSPPPGTRFVGALAFATSAAPLRAYVAGDVTPQPLGVLPDGLGDATCVAACERRVRALAACPWTDARPALLRDVTVARRGDAWFLRDAAGDALPLAPRGLTGPELLAVTGGRPTTVCGLHDASGLRALSVTDGAALVLASSASAPSLVRAG